MKQIFFKTVCEDGGSVWAIGKYRRIYEVGKRYVFDPALPAYVFGITQGFTRGYSRQARPEYSAEFPEQSLDDHEDIYQNRAERTGGRVLICYGVVRNAIIPYCDIGFDWDFKQTRTIRQWVCDDFMVIGEIKPKYPDRSSPCPYAKCKVLKDFDNTPS